MKILLNFKSVVVIGAFNPSILTPGFLKKCCEFKTTHEPTGRTTPVASELSYGNTKFLLELSKFQIAEKDPEGFESVFPLDIASKYLSVLEYTPLNMYGINFNCTIRDINVSAVTARFHDVWQLGDELGIEPISSTYSIRKPNGDGLSLAEFDISRIIDDIKNTVKITFEEDSVQINNNFEIGQLEDDRSRIELLTRQYSELVAQNKTIIDKILEQA